ncbi:hypothetical protein AOC05_09480 [Arthrobacter alpinus]|uniref:Cell envelope-related transcriptional attenuator domain-containing protein n=1 Tax=Arthrobacter alpinus TaxID=656366 RepID=A0A0M4QYP8_9MICC|nr:LCP family protein [Arthrobacter alpinus]ALE92490.1 hypothetical protein AOC05_09480 [Arthrobacter alpinus]
MSEGDGAPGSARRRRNIGRGVLWSVLAVFVIAAVVSGLFVANLAHNFDANVQRLPTTFPNDVSRPVKPTQGPASNAENILLLGSDSRSDDVDLAEQGLPSNQRSDTMMWVHIPADRKNIYMISIMRDTWVTIPGHGEAKINAAMAYGGVPLVVQTVEGMFNSRIDHVAVVDFEGFKAVTDVLGGVTVNVPIPFTSTHGNYTFPAGPQKMTGDQALGFVRERYAFVDGDYQRVKDQQIFLKAVLNTILTPSTLGNPITVTNLVKDVSPYVKVDQDLTAPTLAALALSLRGVRGSDVKSFTLPTLGTGTSADGQSIVLRDDAAISAIAAALANDSMGSYMAGAGLH